MATKMLEQERAQEGLRTEPEGAQEPRPVPAGERPIKTVATGSFVQAVGGLTAVVLAILGLAGVFPSYLAATAAIAVGASLLAEGASVATRDARRGRLDPAQRGRDREPDPRDPLRPARRAGALAPAR